MLRIKNFNTHPRFVQLRERISRGDLGEIYHIEADYLWGRLHKLTDGWRKNTKGYSIVHGASVHMVDLVCWLLDLIPEKVHSMGNKICTIGSDFNSRDFNVALLGFKNGLTAKVSASAGCVHEHFHNVSVYGTKGTYVHNMQGAIYLWKEEDRIRREMDHSEYPAKSHKGELIQNFINSILDEKYFSLVNEKDVFSSMEVCFSIEEAMN